MAWNFYKLGQKKKKTFRTFIDLVRTEIKKIVSIKNYKISDEHGFYSESLAAADFLLSFPLPEPDPDLEPEDDLDREPDLRTKTSFLSRIVSLQKFFFTKV